MSRSPGRTTALRASVALLALVACNDEVDVKNLPPTVELQGYCRQDDRVFVTLRVRDYEGDPVDVDLVATVDGSRRRLPSGSAGDGHIGLTSDRNEGVVHAVEWGVPIELAPKCGDGACTPAPCAGPTCESACQTVKAGMCVRTCESLTAEDPLSDVTACGPRPDAPPAQLALTAFASDGDNVVTTTATLTLQPDCAL
jgi:hypothetical protein